MFKMILEKVHNAHRSKLKEVKIINIIEFMEQLVNKNLTPDELREPTDLISELIRKGEKIE